MERQTRVSKYKELRDEMKEEVGIDRQVIIEEPDENDDFLDFLSHNEKPNLDDTLVEPLTFESLKNDNEDVKTAIHLAKENVGKDQYNTRLDILSKIKQEERKELQTQIKEEPVKKVEDSQKKMSLLEKLAAMSPEEDAEELRKYEEGSTQVTFKTEPAEISDNIENIQMFEEESQVEEDEKESKLVTVLNYMIVLFVIIFVILACFIIKQLLF